MASIEIYAGIFKSARVGMVLLDGKTGRVLDANPAFLRLAVGERDQTLGLCFWGPPLIADDAAGKEAWQTLQAQGVLEGVELPLEAGDGSVRLLEISGSLQAGVYQLEVRDNTGRERARATDRMDALQGLANRTAAEFQAVQRTLQMMGELLLVNASQDRPVLRALEAVQQSSERVSAIASQLHAFGGQVELQLREVSLNEIIQAALPRIRQMLGRNIEIVCDLKTGLEPVTADPVQLRSIILKIARNAAEAMPPRSTFCIQTSAEQPAGTNDGRFAMLAMSDNGPGLDEESWRHVFEPFSTTRNRGANLGLGLASVYGMVRQSGGRLWAYSQAGKGATFRMYFPIAGRHFPALPAAQVAAGGATILLVESNDGLRTVIANLLKKRGYQVVAALDSQEAVRIVETRGAPDLLVGHADPNLIRYLASLQRPLRVLCLAGYEGESNRQTQGLPPWLSILRKPFEPEMLLAAIHRMLNQPL